MADPDTAHLISDYNIQLWMMISNCVMALATVVLGIFSILFVRKQNAILGNQTATMSKQNEIIANQVDVESNTLKLELYDKRFDVFASVMDMLVNLPLVEDDNVDDKIFNQFEASVLHGQLMLSKDVWEYVLQVQFKVKEYVDLYCAYTQIGCTGTPMGIRQGRRLKGEGETAKHKELVEWFRSQPKIALEKFRKDLDLTNIMDASTRGVKI